MGKRVLFLKVFRSLKHDFVGKKQNEAWRAVHPCACFGLFGRKVTWNFLMMLSTTKQSNYIMYALVNWVRVYIEDHSMTIIGFVDWLSFKWGKGIFCVSSSCLDWVCIVYMVCTLVRLLLGAFNIFSHFPSKRKKGKTCVSSLRRHVVALHFYGMSFWRFELWVWNSRHFPCV